MAKFVYHVGMSIVYTFFFIFKTYVYTKYKSKNPCINVPIVKHES